MFPKYLKLLLSVLFLVSFVLFSARGEIVDKIEIKGNERITDETVIMFSNVKVGSDVTKNDLNEILKTLYNTNFFKDLEISLKDNKLIISLIENPIIENVTYNGIKSNDLRELKEERQLKNIA